MGRDFKKFGIWQQAYKLVLDVYPLLDKLPDKEKNNLIDQIRRAVTSLPLNIAEGAGNPSNRVFLNHLTYAYGSAKELEVLFMLCKDLKYINEKKYDELSEKLESFKKSMYGFMTSVEKEVKIGKKNFSFYKGWKK